MIASETALKDLKQMIDDQINLPSPPVVAVRILDTVKNEESGFQDLESIITTDPALCSKMLRIANSAFYSIPQEISNIGRALSILGTNVVKNIALSFVIAEDLKKDHTAHYFDFDYFWRRSVTAAVAAELVTHTIGKKDDEIFVSALLQDIGVLVMYLSKGPEYAEIIKKSRINVGYGLIELEREKYGFDHQIVGTVLLESWHIPQCITRPLGYHHLPEKAPREVRDKATILSLADLLSVIYSGKESSENVRILQQRMADSFNIGPHQTRDLLDEVARRTIELLDIFEVDPGTIKPYSLMLQEANDQLGKLNLSYEQLVLELKESKEKAERFAQELQNANSKLEELAFRDGLTGLYNHRFFQENLAKEIGRAKRYGHHLSLILFDIDFFKKVNDTYGHPTGDKVLINLANAVIDSVRPGDIVARYGGEEFAVILAETSLGGLKVFAERLRRAAATLITPAEGDEIQITISCGGAHLSPETQCSKQLFVDVADRCLYQSKASGRNRVTTKTVTGPTR